VLVAAVALVVSCGVFTSCAFEGGSTSGGPRPVDGRDVAFTCPVPNYSMTEPMTLISAQLIGAVGLELVEVSTVSFDYQIGIGQPIPPKPTDCDDGNIGDCVANWAKRVPLAESVVPPDDALQMVLVVRPTSDEPCVHARGVATTYKQGWWKHTDRGCMQMVVRSGDFGSCDHVFDR